MKRWDSKALFMGMGVLRTNEAFRLTYTTEGPKGVAISTLALSLFVRGCPKMMNCHAERSEASVFHVRGYGFFGRRGDSFTPQNDNFRQPLHLWHYTKL